MTTKTNKKPTAYITTECRDQLETEMIEINKDRPGGKITPNDYLLYFLKNITDSDREKIRKSKITWKGHEEPRLKKLYIEKHGEISEEAWDIKKSMGELKKFFKAYSRIDIASN